MFAPRLPTPKLGSRTLGLDLVMRDQRPAVDRVSIYGLSTLEVRT